MLARVLLRQSTSNNRKRISNNRENMFKITQILAKSMRTQLYDGPASRPPRFAPRCMFPIVGIIFVLLEFFDLHHFARINICLFEIFISDKREYVQELCPFVRKCRRTSFNQKICRKMFKMSKHGTK